MTLYVHEQGSGDALVLIHGWGFNHACWQPIQDILANQYRSIAIDLPGHGYSKAIDNMTLDTIVDLLAQQLPPTARLCGWSLGGLVAIAYAHAYPHRVSHLTTVGCNPKFIGCEQWPGVTTEVFDNFESRLLNNMAATLKEFLLLQTLGDRHARQLAKSLWQQMQSIPMPQQTALLQGLAILKTTDLRSQLTALPMQQQHVFGARDAIVPHTIASFHPGPSEVYPRSAHAPFLTHTDDFCKRLLA